LLPRLQMDLIQQFTSVRRPGRHATTFVGVDSGGDQDQSIGAKYPPQTCEYDSAWGTQGHSASKPGDSGLDPDAVPPPFQWGELYWLLPGYMFNQKMTLLAARHHGKVFIDDEVRRLKVAAIKTFTGGTCSRQIPAADLPLFGRDVQRARWSSRSSRHVIYWWTEWQVRKSRAGSTFGDNKDRTAVSTYSD